MPYLASQREYSCFLAELSMGSIMGCCPDPAEHVTEYMEDVSHVAFLYFKTSKFQNILDHRDIGPIFLFLLTNEEAEKLSNQLSRQLDLWGWGSPFLSWCSLMDKWLD